MKKITTSPFTPTNVEIESVGTNRVKISAYPFESGYGITLAHPLKRLLLSSSVGFAPIAIKIDGVNHEFDSVRGMLEDVSTFIINLKRAIFKIKDGADTAILDYSFNGSKELKGIDLSNNQVDVINSDIHLAVLNEDAHLNFTIIIKKGMGYVPSEDIRDIIDDGFIPMDAYFTPVKKVVYEIEQMLVEDNPNFERVVFDILTDGQVDAIDAFKKALSVMYKQLSVFDAEFNISINGGTKRDEENPEMKKLLQKIDTLNLSARSFNCLDRASIFYVGELVLMNEDELAGIKNLGKKSLEEIKEKLEEIGYPAHENLTESLASQLRKKLDLLKG